MSEINPEFNKRSSDNCASSLHACAHAKDSAESAVRKVFAILGVDIDDPEKVEEFRMDLRFGRSMRKAADRGFIAIVGMAAMAIGAALWVGITTGIRGGH